ncbi:MAG: metalloregulator ArsR/SmtB family transcription factor [Actinomycetota bacterium]|nr:metalloregulator ArsR/SmtB family transcription factor [Actinomycetota bacterium]
MVSGSSPKCKEDPRIEHLAKALKVLSDPHRLRIVCLLKRGAKCVCEVEEELAISQQLTSFHLRVLREAGFLKLRREGASYYYSIDEEFLRMVSTTFKEYVAGQEVEERDCMSCSI